MVEEFEDYEKCNHQWLPVRTIKTGVTCKVELLLCPNCNTIKAVSTKDYKVFKTFKGKQ